MEMFILAKLSFCDLQNPRAKYLFLNKILVQKRMPLPCCADRAKIRCVARFRWIETNKKTDTINIK